MDNGNDSDNNLFGRRERRISRAQATREAGEKLLRASTNRTAEAAAEDNPKPTLPDFDTLRDLARENPEELERLRIALCQKVIDEAPEHAKPRLEGLLFQINARREIARTHLEAAQELSTMMNHSLKRMQSMLKDLRTIQSESILLTTRHDKDKKEPVESAKILSFAPRASAKQ